MESGWEEGRIGGRQDVWAESWTCERQDGRKARQEEGKDNKKAGQEEARTGGGQTVIDVGLEYKT